MPKADCRHAHTVPNLFCECVESVCVAIYRLLSPTNVDLRALVGVKLWFEAGRLSPAEGIASLSGTVLDHLDVALVFYCEREVGSTHIRTLRSSPAEANMLGFTGFQATALTQPLPWPWRVSTRTPLPLCQMYIFESSRR